MDDIISSEFKELLSLDIVWKWTPALPEQIINSHQWIIQFPIAVTYYRLKEILEGITGGILSWDMYPIKVSYQINVPSPTEKNITVWINFRP